MFSAKEGKCVTLDAVGTGTDLARAYISFTHAELVIIIVKSSMKMILFKYPLPSMSNFTLIGLAILLNLFTK